MKINIKTCWIYLGFVLVVLGLVVIFDGHKINKKLDEINQKLNKDTLESHLYEALENNKVCKDLSIQCVLMKK